MIFYIIYILLNKTVERCFFSPEIKVTLFTSTPSGKVLFKSAIPASASKAAGLRHQDTPAGPEMPTLSGGPKDMIGTELKPLGIFERERGPAHRAN